MESIKDDLLIDALNHIDELEDENECLETLLDIMEDDLLEIEDEPLEGLSDNGVVDKHQAVEGLAFHLENDRDFYLAYQDKIVKTVKECLPKDFTNLYTQNSNIVTHWSGPTGYTMISMDNVNHYAVKVAQIFLDEFIQNVKDTKEANEEYFRARAEAEEAKQQTIQDILDSFK